MRPITGLLLAATLAWPQQQPQETVTFKAQSNLVVVNVSVRDRAGKPITNLKKEDFSVLEDDKPQSLAVFELQHLDGEALPPLQEGPRTFAERNPAKPAANINEPASGAKRFQDKRLIALLFDLSSMQPPEQIRAQDAAIKFLNSQMTSSDMVSIMTFGASFKEVQEFTNDRDLLISTIKKFRTGEGSDLATDGTVPDEDNADDSQFVADETEFNIFNTDRKLSALETAAKKLSIFPEKKALVYISSGVGKTGMENQAQLRSTVATAIRSNVAFYPIDARGLLASAPLGDASQAGPKGSGVFSGKSQTSARSKFQDQQETLYTLAADTGGKALLDSNDLSVGITQVQKDVESYYILGYYSTNAAQDGRFRKIRVKLNGNLQAKLDYRQGYFAQKEFRKFNASDKERQLEEALLLGDPVNELALAIEIDYFRLGKDKYFVPISVKIPGSAIGLSKKGSRQSADLDFIGQVRDEKNKLVSSVRDAITVKLNENDATELGHRNLQYDTGLTLAPGVYRLTFLARENQSGKMGTFESKFTIPDLGTESKNVRLSSVVWAGQRDKVTSAVGSASNDKKAIAAHPLIQDGQKLVPNITRVFRRNQNLYVYAEVYDGSPSIAADLVLFQGGRKAFESTPLLITSPTRPGVSAVQFQVSLASLPPGRYTSQLNVIDEAGKRFAFARSPVVILP
jgi:VWFA-related protein